MRSGSHSRLDPGPVWKLLRTDAELIAQAISRAQRVALGDRPPSDVVWENDPAEQERLREEKNVQRQKAREAHFREWGRWRDF